MKKDIDIVTKNRKAKHDYFIEDKFEAGIVLKGSEVKSLRMGAANLKDSYAEITSDQEVYLHNAHISQYKHASHDNHDPERKRKLLLHKNQIKRLERQINKKNYTLIPLKIYFNNKGLAKVELALAKGKKKYDKRHSIKEKETQERIDRIRKERY